MKELLTIASNFLACYNTEGKLMPQTEVILVLSEPVYSTDPTGEVVRRRETSQTRFLASPAVLRSAAKALLDLAEESERRLTPSAISSQPSAT